MVSQQFMFVCLILTALHPSLSAVLDPQTIRFGIQKEQGYYHASKCDSSILGELLKEELWAWTYDEIENFLEAEFDLGHVELENSELDYLQLLSNTTNLAAGAATSSPQERVHRAAAQYDSTTTTLQQRKQPLHLCSDASSLCQHWIAPLSIHHSNKNNNKYNNSPTHLLRGRNYSMLSRMADGIKSALHAQLSVWMTDNTVLIGNSCASDISTLKVSVEIVDE
jgi:hypothetical protein